MNELLDSNYLIELNDFPDYFVDMYGNIFSDKFGKMRKLKPRLNSRGYFRVCLRKNGKQYTKPVHRLVTQTFLPNPENKPCVDHINRNCTDNRLENLRWVTRSENSRNYTKRSDNTSGIMGVYFHKAVNMWVAQWCDDNGIRTSKAFSTNKHQNAKQLAINHRKEMENRYYPTLTSLV